MRILLDTNIFIYREDDKIIPKNLQTLLQILGKIRTEILIHPLSAHELHKDNDEKRKAIILSKVGSYSQLDSPPDPITDSIYLQKVKQISNHDRIDNSILFAVYKNAVDFLITEDKGIHRKAIDIGISDRILLIDDALQIFQNDVKMSKPISPPALKEDYVYNLDLTDPIFDTLKKDYQEFPKWFEKISREGRRCWVHYRQDNRIGALLIYKIEDEPIDGTPPLPTKKRLKISLFIVTTVGQKIGELFIKLSIDYSVKNNIFEMYLTHFTEPDDRLVHLITEYGFKKVSVNRRGEDIFLKELIADVTNIKDKPPLGIVKEYYPSFYDGVNVKKFIIPIQPNYHTRLFTDYTGRQTKITEHSGEFIIEGNTIKKAYLTNSKITKTHKGDILLFYRSKDKSEITSLGVLESIHRRLTDPDKIIKIVGKRTVYSRIEIEELTKKPTTVLLFYHISHLPNPIPFHDLKEIGALFGPPQSICGIDEDKYHEIIRRSGIDERFTIH
ncbi:MAG: PIN domain-containing protein [Methanocellales archaeon]|nr:PIN domain-containing protein [Methanocellales archaeon]MDD3292047.1 PIN domain-containing protein [Methanocellales archaeon]MDD5235572.1 PIN domain-containing protein [Methanocellales archaeon]MDD5485596.1 PIN domain-containing protein [Methanocellales archaeon]